MLRQLLLRRRRSEKALFCNDETSNSRGVVWCRAVFDSSARLYGHLWAGFMVLITKCRTCNLFAEQVLIEYNVGVVLRVIE